MAAQLLAFLWHNSERFQWLSTGGFFKFSDFIINNEINNFYVTGADAVACVKTSCNGLLRAGYQVTVIADCITSYDKRKIKDLLAYYELKGCTITDLGALLAS